MLLNCLKEDIKRLQQESPADHLTDGLRPVLRGLLSPGFQAILVYRIFRAAHLKGIPTQPLRYAAERYVEITTGISIPVEADFGPGLRIHHFGNVIVHPKVKVGKNCTLFHDVTLGTDGRSEGAPKLGDDVLLGSGARVLGEISLGDRCRVGANAVVVKSFPEDAVLVGVPAQNVRKNHDPSP